MKVTDYNLLNKIWKYIDINHCVNHTFDEEWDICLVFLKYKLVKRRRKSL